jgi:DNA repair protein RadA/Sms
VAWQCICGAWSSFVEEKVLPAAEEDTRRRTTGISGKNAKASKLSAISAEGKLDRIDTGIGELNRVLGGGIVKGSLTLISGEPGIGKSTLIMHAAHNIAKAGNRVL